MVGGSTSILWYVLLITSVLVLLHSNSVWHTNTVHVPRIRNPPLVSGDLVFFMASSTMSIFTGRFAHVGMVVILRGSQYILEIRPEHVLPTITPVNIRLRGQDVAIRPIRKHISQRSIRETVEMCTGLKYSHSYVYSILHRIGLPIVLPSCHLYPTTYCSDLIYRVAIHLRRAKRTPSVPLPSDMFLHTWSHESWGPAFTNAANFT